MGSQTIPLEWFEFIVTLFLGLFSLLWFGVTWRVYMNNERRLVELETYADPRNEDIRNKLLMAQFREMLAQMELRLGNNLESKRASIESAITQVGDQIVNSVKKNGGS